MQDRVPDTLSELIGQDAARLSWSDVLDGGPAIQGMPDVGGGCLGTRRSESSIFRTIRSEIRVPISIRSVTARRGAARSRRKRREVEVGARKDSLDTTQSLDSGLLIGECSPVDGFGVDDPVQNVVEAALDVGRVRPAGQVVLLERIGTQIE